MGATATEDRTTQPRRTVAAAAAAAVFLSGMAAGGALSDRRAGGAPEADTAPAASSVSDPAPTTETGDVVPGFARSRDGAHAAAIAYTSTLSQRLLYLKPADVEGAIRAVAADASADALASTALVALETAREPLAADTAKGPTWWAVRPLAVRVEAYSPARARVSVWVMRVLSRQGVVVPQSSWVTETVEVVWERGDWRLWSVTTMPGPTPVLDGSDMPASAAELDQVLAGFEVLGTEGQRR